MGHTGASEKPPNVAPREKLSQRFSRPLTLIRIPAGHLQGTCIPQTPARIIKKNKELFQCY